MPFGVVSRVSRRMRVLYGAGDHRRGRGSFGVNMWRSTVTKGDFAKRLFTNYFGQDLLCRRFHIQNQPTASQ